MQFSNIIVPEKDKVYIYFLKDKDNNIVYVGQTTCLLCRLDYHRSVKTFDRTKTQVLELKKEISSKNIDSVKMNFEKLNSLVQEVSTELYKTSKETTDEVDFEEVK